MSFRFRKSVNFGPFRVNASKSGLGWSVGGKGMRYTKTANGAGRVTASVPGTGVSYSTSTGKSARGSSGKQKKGGSGALAMILTLLVVGGCMYLGDSSVRNSNPVSMPSVSASASASAPEAQPIPTEEVAACFADLAEDGTANVTTPEGKVVVTWFSPSCTAVAETGVKPDGWDDLLSRAMADYTAAETVVQSADPDRALTVYLSSEASTSSVIYATLQGGSQIYDYFATLPDPAQEEAPATQPAASVAGSTAPAPEPTEEQVYISKTGKRYHKSSKCSGGKYTQVPISEAISRGLTPCKKCAGG